jgi:Endonuclease/Exonuclease/phosphatase family
MFVGLVKSLLCRMGCHLLKMNQITIGFWNLQNLFDTNATDIASDFEFTPQRGWTKEVLNIKLENLAKVIKSIDSNGPDILGLCEIENESLVRRLIDKIGRDDYEVASYKDSPDIRGIDTCLIYSTTIFDCLDTISRNVHFRYPTRDIFQAHLRVKANNAEIDVIVSHWPSRRGKRESCDPNDTEYSRCMVAENCGKIIDNLLKIPGGELNFLPDDFLQNQEILERINQSWNRNILLMGDLNDEPFDKSVTRYLGATSNVRLLREWKEILELGRHIDGRDKKADRQHYLEYPASLYNCMWRLLPDGAHYYWGSNNLCMFDQFIISRGLYFGIQKLKMNLESIKIIKNGLTFEENLSQDKFDPQDLERAHPALKVGPMPFEYYRMYKDKNNNPHVNERSIPRWREPNTGYSDHFPIQGTIDIVD